MTGIAPTETPETRASVVGRMCHSRPATGFQIVITPALPGIPATLPGTATTNTRARDLMVIGVTNVRYSERTIAGPVGQVERVPEASTAEAVMEIRRRSGLTWEELGDLFDVSRRSIHHWANGKPVTARHEQTVRRMLAVVRHLDRGCQGGTRALLRTVDQTTGLSVLDLLKGGRFEEATGRVEIVQAPEPHRVPLSRAAQDTRRPPAPVLLLEAEQDRPDIPAGNARAVHPRRTSVTTG